MFLIKNYQIVFFKIIKLFFIKNKKLFSTSKLLKKELSIFFLFINFVHIIILYDF